MSRNGRETNDHYSLIPLPLLIIVLTEFLVYALLQKVKRDAFLEASAGLLGSNHDMFVDGAYLDILAISPHA